jgi:hypothetical protein
MGVWEIMNIDKSIEALKETQKKRLGTVGFPDAHAETRKSIDPQLDRSLPNNDFLLNQTERANSRIDNPDPITQPCRDCPEGMQW